MTNNHEPKPSTKRAWIVAGIFMLLFVGGIFLFLNRTKPTIFAPGTKNPTPIPGEEGTPSPTDDQDPYGIDIQLREGKPQENVPESLPVATGEPLSPEEAVSILARLPVLTPDPAQQTEFHRPPESLPPPRPEETIPQSFPSAETGPTPSVESGPLQVLRFAPEGEIPVAPFVSVTFNQAMVPIGTLGDLAAEDVPVIIEPSLTGTWRWLGTKTLTFNYDSELIDRLPKATEYRVTVPAGVRSAGGESLADSVTWTFQTPPPKITQSYPYADEPQPLDPILFLAFDQRVDPAAVLRTIEVRANGRLASLVLASQAEIDANERVSQLVKDAGEGRWLAFRAAEPFPAGTEVSVTLGPGTPSAEGPLLTTEAQSFHFSTYMPLAIVRHECAWYDEICRPLTPFSITFSNPLDTDAYTTDTVRVEPEIPGLSILTYGNTLEIHGETRGQTTYTVTVSGKIRDVFGQELGKDATLTFKVGKAESILIGPEGRFVTLDPTTTDATFSVYAINYSRLNLKVYAVQPSDWNAFLKYLQDWRWSENATGVPGRLVAEKQLRLELPSDTLTQVDIDLKPYMTGNFGHFIVVVEPPRELFESEQDKYRRYSQTVLNWVQITQIGLDAYTDHSEMVAWATDLKDGRPLQGVSIQANDRGTPALSGQDGVVRFAIPSGATYLVARQGADQAMLPNSMYSWAGGSWNPLPVKDSLRWYVFDDRQMYRPGEEMHVKGWLRRIGERQNGDVTLPGSDLSSITYRITDPQGNTLGEGQAEANSLGGFDFAFTIPPNTNLGTAYINLTAVGNFSGLDGTQWYHDFQIQEFRRPEFEVTARNETSGPFFVEEAAMLAVEAKYYAGGGLPNADVTWQVSTTPGSYSPPHWEDFTFGNWEPWWWYYDEYSSYDYQATQSETFTGRTDASGTHYLGMDFLREGDPAQDPEPKSVSAQATVMDVNRQAWSSTTTLLVHPADVYIGLRTERYFVNRGTPLEVEFIVTDLDGEPVADRPVEIRAGRMEWQIRNGDWVEEETDVQTCTLRSTTEPGTCSFETPVGGTYQITALVTDKAERKNQSRFTRWVSGGQRPPSRKVEQEEVTLVPDQETYQPGDTAQILVQAPFSPAEGLLTVSRSGILYTTRFRVEQGSITLEIPIEEKHLPNLHIQVDLAGSAPRTDDQGEPLENVPPRPAYATAQLTLNIPPLKRTLALEVEPDQKAMEPGGRTHLTVTVKDARGFPVPDAELAVVVVDEAVLALTSYQMEDPLSVFYSTRPSYLSSVYGRASLVLADPQALARQAAQNGGDVLLDGAASAPAATEAPAEEYAEPAPAFLPQATATAMGRDKSAAQGQTPIDVRTNFNPLAVFAATVRTGPDGLARVAVDLPDNLTRYRVMAVAVDSVGNQFGTGESNLTARLPLMVRPSAPRFLNFGDKFELPVVLQNQTDGPLTVHIVARATNLELENAGMRVTVPANDRVEVRFPASTVMAGTTRIQFAAASGEYADAATVVIPVYTPATSEAFATYGVIDEGAVAQPVLYPSEVFSQYGGLEINTSSTAVQALTDAVLYLVNYPFECSEQIASRVLGVAALRDVLTAFEADGLPAPEEMEAAVNRDIERLRGMQNYDGGFPYWRQGFESKPFNTIHVTHALIRAGQKGFSVPADMQQNALTYLHEIESHYPSWYSQSTRWTLSAYALYVRNLGGDRDAAKAEALLREAGVENLSMEALGWLWSVIDDESQLQAIRTYVNNHVVETAGAANFTTSYDDQTYLLLSSDRRTDAILLDALIEDNPQSDLIPKVVNGLLAHRTQGRWGNTQENVFVLLTLDRYFNTYEAETPDFVARIWLGNTYAGSSEFRGRTMEVHETLVPMMYVLSETAGGTQDLILSKDGPGRLYYRLGLRYAPTDLRLDPLDMGFVVQRRYEGIDDPKDVWQDSEGIWHIKAGAKVRVKVTMVADNRRYHVALVDPLPAGLEIVNPELAVSESVPEDPTSPDYRYGWWWWGTWYEHQNLRDDRAEAFASLLWDGVYEYSYVARATTPGTFVVPPAKAEEMYSPEVFGRSGSDFVIVE